MKMETLKSKKYLIWLSVILAFFAISFAISTSNVANGQDCNVKAISTEAELNAAIEAGGTFALVSDVDITSTKDIVAKDASYELDLDLAEFSLVANGNFRMFNIANNNGAQITIESNQNGALNGAGVAVANNTGSVNISGVTFQNCTAETGAALSLKDASVALNNVVINWCSASAYGSAIYCADNNSAINTSLKLANSTITNNVGGLGSVYIDTNSAIIPNVTLSGANTITGNSADVYVPSFKNFKFNLVGSLLNSKIGVNTADVIEDGEEVTFTAGFASNSNGANPSDVFASNNSNYKVVWNANNNEAALSTTEKSAMYSVEFEFDGNGIVNSVNNSYKAGQTVEVYTSANAGYKFEKLTVNGEDVFNTNFIMPSCNTTVYASFIKVNADSSVNVIMPVGTDCTYSEEIPSGWERKEDWGYAKSFPVNTRCIDVCSEWNKESLHDSSNKGICESFIIDGCLGEYLYTCLSEGDLIKINVQFCYEKVIDKKVMDKDNQPIEGCCLKYLCFDIYELHEPKVCGTSDEKGTISTSINASDNGFYILSKDGFYDLYITNIEQEPSYYLEKIDDDLNHVTFTSNILYGNWMLGLVTPDDNILALDKSFSYDFSEGLKFGLVYIPKYELYWLGIFDSNNNQIYTVNLGISSLYTSSSWYFVDENGIRKDIDPKDTQTRYDLKDGYKFYATPDIDCLYTSAVYGPSSCISIYNNNINENIKSEISISNTVNDVTKNCLGNFIDLFVNPETTFKLVDGQISYEGTYYAGIELNDGRDPDQLDTKGIIKSASDNLYISNAYFNNVPLSEDGIKIEDPTYYKVALEFAQKEPEVYSITCENAEHGSIEANVSEAAAGDVVNLTATPDDGYELDTVTSEQVTIENMSFKMPAEDVVISATFKEAEAPQPEPGHETEDVNGSAQTGDMTGSYVLGIAVLFIASLGLCLGRKKYFNVK